MVYRGVKPENAVVDARGYAVLVDLGLAKRLSERHAWRTYSLCGDPEFVSPELLLRAGYGRDWPASRKWPEIRRVNPKKIIKGGWRNSLSLSRDSTREYRRRDASGEVDLWALGVLLFELLVGHPPFCDTTPLGVYQLVLDGRYQEPAHLRDKDHASFRAFLKRLLVKDPKARATAANCKQLPWLQATDWPGLLARDRTPPFVPSEHFDRKAHFDDVPNEHRDSSRAHVDHAENTQITDDLFWDQPGSHPSSSTPSRAKSPPHLRKKR